MLSQGEWEKQNEIELNCINMYIKFILQEIIMLKLNSINIYFHKQVEKRNL